MPEIWAKWLPGVLSRAQLKSLCDSGFVQGAEADNLEDPSLDLHLSNEGYELVGGAVKPFGREFLSEILAENLAKRIQPDGNGEFHLKEKITYLFRLKESLNGNCDKVMWGQATAKSSVGRLDVLARLVVDGMRHYESFSGEHLSADVSKLYLEVTPFTFPVIVKEGISLSQLRIFYGTPKECEVDGKEVYRTCFAGDDTNQNQLTVDLSPTEINGVFGCCFRAKSQFDSNNGIRLWKLPPAEKPDPALWWDLVAANKNNRVKIAKGQFFHILRSHEKLSIPPGIAVYARAIDEEIGEMRIHYAGFAHPYFGWERNDGESGTPLIFEVRGHDVDVNLRDGEILARLQFFRMSEDEVEPTEEKAYGKQILKLSGFFGEWRSAPNLVTSQ